MPGRVALFHDLAAKLLEVRPEVHQVVCCPLCLHDFRLDAIQRLRPEHIVSRKLGGRSQTLTCFDCNSRHGSALDSQLIGAMKALDAIEGRERIAATTSNAAGKLRLDMLVPQLSEVAPVNLNVIGEASNPAAVENLRASLAPDFELTIHMRLPVIPERYWRAAVRSAYLAIFRTEGYGYVFSEGATPVRNAISGAAPARHNVVMEAFPEQGPPGDLLVMPHSFRDVGEWYIVLLRMQSKRTRYLAVVLPGKHGCDWTSLGTVYDEAPRLRSETTPHEWNSTLVINLGHDPIGKLREPGQLFKQLFRR